MSVHLCSCSSVYPTSVLKMRTGVSQPLHTPAVQPGRSGAAPAATTPDPHAPGPSTPAIGPSRQINQHRQRKGKKKPKNKKTPQKLGRKRDLPFAATPRLAEPLLTKNELGTNSSSESESGVGWATPLPSNRLWLSLAGGEGGGEGDCSIGVDEADEQCKGAPANHKDKHRQKKIMKIGFEAHGDGDGDGGRAEQNKTRINGGRVSQHRVIYCTRGLRAELMPLGKKLVQTPEEQGPQGREVCEAWKEGTPWKQRGSPFCFACSLRGT